MNTCCFSKFVALVDGPNTRTGMSNNTDTYTNLCQLSRDEQANQARYKSSSPSPNTTAEIPKINQLSLNIETKYKKHRKCLKRVSVNPILFKIPTSLHPVDTQEQDPEFDEDWTRIPRCLPLPKNHFKNMRDTMDIEEKIENGIRKI